MVDSKNLLSLARFGILSLRNLGIFVLLHFLEVTNIFKSNHYKEFI